MEHAPDETKTSEKLVFSPEKFKDNFPDGEINEISSEQITDNAMDFFERKSSMYIHPKNYKPGNFRSFYEIRHGDESKTYVAEQIKTYDSGEQEINTYFVDIYNDEIAGYSELRLGITNEREYFKNKPFVGFTKTYSKFGKRNLAERRLYMMNAFSKMRYDFPIYSDTVMTDRPKEMWERLVSERKAKKIKEGEKDRYVLGSD